VFHVVQIFHQLGITEAHKERKETEEKGISRAKAQGETGMKGFL
jgi:hypothetical protein